MPLFRRKSEKQTSNPQIAPSGSKLSHSASSDSGFSASSWNGQPSLPRPQTLLLSDPSLLQNSDIPPEALESPVRTRSSLSKTLQEVLKDKDALSCFISFMKAQRADQLIQFWCDAQSFQANTLMRMRTHALQSVSKSTILKRRSGSLMKDEAGTINVERVDLPAVEGEERITEGDHTEKLNKSVFSPHDSSSHEHSNIGSSCSKSMDLVQTFPLHFHQSTVIASDIVSSAELSSASCDDNLHPSHSLSSNTPPLKTCQNVSSATHASPSQLELGKMQCSSSMASDDRCNRNGHSSPTESAISHSSARSKLDYDIMLKNITENGSLDRGGMTEKSDQSDHSQSTSLSHSEGEQQTSAVQEVTSDTCVEDVAGRLRKSVECDAVKIFSTYVAKDAPRPIGVDDQMRAETISRICMEDGNVDPQCFQQCQDFVLKKFETQYFQSFKDSEYHCRHQINVLTSGQVYLPDILLAENALCYFMEYMEQEGASDLMQLWLAVENFQQQLTSASHSYDWQQAQNDAMVIYDKYFSLQASHPMGFDDKLRFEIESNICREGGPLPECFTKAKILVLQTLDKIHFSQYLKSQVFHRYLSDLVSTVQVAEDLQNKPFSKGHRRNASDASSEHSIGSQCTGAELAKPRNTLLAVDTRRVKKGAHIEGDFSMSMEMFNPDDLWKRTSPGGMSLGSVDELGQFVSAFDSQTIVDKKKGSGFLRRWKDKEKEQEEMALQIAQMIIQDVNTMTTQRESFKERKVDPSISKDKTGS